jgi:geminin
MSRLNIENVPPPTRETQFVKTKSSNSTSSSGRSGHKKLQTLQPSAKNQQLLVGADGVVRLGGTGKKKEIKIYQDPTPPAHTSTPEQKKKSEDKTVQATVSSVSAGTQVEDADTAQHRADVEMYGAEEDLPLEYWKDLAEKRREALEVSLTENESLHTSLSMLEEENERIKEEAETYKSLAEQAQELASILNNIVSDEEEEESDQEGEDENGEEKAADEDQEKLEESNVDKEAEVEPKDKSD